MLVRLANEQDLPALESFFTNEPMGTGWTVATCQQVLKQSGDSMWVASDERCALSGVLIARAVAGEAELLNIIVTSDRRRQGLGRKLMEEFISEMRATGITRLFLEVRASNVAAISLYDGLGFEQVGLRVGYYQPDHEDALVLACTI